MIEFTYNSNAIEGNTLTLQETALVLEGITIDQKPLKDHLEAVGHRDAFVYVQQLVSNKVPLEERTIKEVHSLVLMDRPEDKGLYRRIPVRIMGAALEPQQPYSVPKKMKQLINKKEEPCILWRELPGSILTLIFSEQESIFRCSSFHPDSL